MEPTFEGNLSVKREKKMRMDWDKVMDRKEEQLQ